MSEQTGPYEFGDYRLDPGARTLAIRDRPIALAPKSFDLLLLLLESRGRVLARDELFRALWPDTVVEEANLTFQVSTVRKALGGEGAKWIETVPKHGYRFTGPVRSLRPGRSVGDIPAPVATPSPRRVWPVAAAALALALAIAGFAFLRGHETSDRADGPPGPTVVPLTTYPGPEAYPALSPDGTQVAFSWPGPQGDNADIYLKLVGPGEPLRLTTDEAYDFSPAWSPDGRQIAFLRSLDTEDERRAILLIPALGGAERRIAEVELTEFRSHASLLAWTPDGKWLAAAARFRPGAPSEIWLISPETGERRRLTVGPDVQTGDVGLAFSPDGRFLAVLRFATRSVGDLYLLPLGSPYEASGALVRLTYENLLVSGPCWLGPNRIAYSTGGALAYRTARAVTFDPAHPERRVVPAPLPAGEHATILTAARNRLVYARENRDANIWRLPLSPATGQRAPALLAASTFNEHNPDFSADGRRITFTSTRSGTEEIWVANADGSDATQMTSMGGPNTSNSRWSRDGLTILFNSRRSGSSDLYLLDVASRSVRRLTDDPSEEYEPRWSRDGAWIYFVSTRTGRSEVWKMPAAGGAAVQVTRHGGEAAFESPDGRWVYYAKDRGRPASIWRVPAGGGDEVKVLDGLSYSFNFAVTGKGLYLLALRRSPDAARVEFFDLATRRTTVLHTLDRPFWFGFAVAPDERSLLFSKVDSQGSDLMLVENLP